MNDVWDTLSDGKGRTAKQKKITEHEWGLFRKTILVGRLFNGKGVRSLFSSTKWGLKEPANFGRILPQYRFEFMMHWMPWAWAHLPKMVPAAQELIANTGGKLKVPSHPLMTFYRKLPKNKAYFPPNCTYLWLHCKLTTCLKLGVLYKRREQTARGAGDQ